MRYFVRNQHGELTVKDYAELRTLYHRQFIGDEDEIRRDGSERWVKAGSMPDLRVIKPKPWFEGYEFAWISIGVCGGTRVICLLMMWS